MSWVMTMGTCLVLGLLLLNAGCCSIGGGLFLVSRCVLLNASCISGEFFEVGSTVAGGSTDGMLVRTSHDFRRLQWLELCVTEGSETEATPLNPVNMVVSTICSKRGRKSSRSLVGTADRREGKNNSRESNCTHNDAEGLLQDPLFPYAVEGFPSNVSKGSVTKYLATEVRSVRTRADV